MAVAVTRSSAIVHAAPRRGRRRRATSRPRRRSTAGRGRDARSSSRSPESSAGLRARAVFRALDPELEFEALARTATPSRRRPRRARRRLARGDPDRRAHRAQPPRPALGHRDADAPLRRRDRRHRRGSSTRARRRPACARSRSTPSHRRRANHRFGLDDARPDQGQPPARRRRDPPPVEPRAPPGLPVEVECDTLEQVRGGARAGADAILLDNMTPGPAARGRRPRRAAAPGSRPPAASRSRPSARSPRPASTTSRSAR